MNRERLLATAKRYQTGTYSVKFVAPVFAKMIRAEAAADPRRYAPAFVDGLIIQVERSIGQCVCVTCGTVNRWDSGVCGIHTGHFLASRCNSIMYEEENAAPQCSYCNCELSGNPTAFRRWMTQIRGAAAVKRLEHLKVQSVQFTREELVDKRMEFESRLASAIERMKVRP